MSTMVLNSSTLSMQRPSDGFQIPRIEGGRIAGRRVDSESRGIVLCNCYFCVVVAALTVNGRVIAEK